MGYPCCRFEKPNLPRNIFLSDTCVCERLGGSLHWVPKTLGHRIQNIFANGCCTEQRHQWSYTITHLEYKNMHSCGGLFFLSWTVTIPWRDTIGIELDINRTQKQSWQGHFWFSISWSRDPTFFRTQTHKIVVSVTLRSEVAGSSKQLPVSNKKRNINWAEIHWIALKGYLEENVELSYEIRGFLDSMFP